MKALIIGAAGFVGKYLIDHLRDDRGWSVCATKLPRENIAAGNIEVIDLDILDRDAVSGLLRDAGADYIFHLAAQSSVALSWKEPKLTAQVNVGGVINVLEAVRGLAKKPRILLIGSGEEYGNINAEELPIKEDTNLRPGNIYAATKACQGMIGKIYADAYGMDAMMVRAFNHIGPGQSETFVVSDFCKQVVEIEAGRREPVIDVGNLAAQRDFTDVRDVVRAYSLLIEKGERGETYNVGSGKAIAIEDILNVIVGEASVDISVRVSKEKFRPVDIPRIEAATAKLVGLTGWRPEISLETTVNETLGYWREKVAENTNV